MKTDRSSKYKASESMLQVTMLFALSKADETTINAILISELKQEEKRDLIVSLDHERLKTVLKNLGFTEDYLNSL
jgi:hypothetical protein